jgi:endonuclease YncB( thermonuclease family)
VRLSLPGLYCVRPEVERSRSTLARVVDGDTLAIDGARVRLFGIDAPERGQPCRDRGDCGAEATAYLVRLIDGRTVQCKQEDIDQYSRVVGMCFVGRTDLSWALVCAGHAAPYLEFCGAMKAMR